MSQPTQLTDAEVIRALFASGIPAAYHRKDRTLQTLHSDAWPEVEAAVRWVKDDAHTFAALGSAMEISATGMAGFDFTYLLARALVLTGHAVACISLPVLRATIATRYEQESAALLDEWQQSSFLFLIDCFDCTGIAAPYDRQSIYEMEWFLRSWMLADRALVLHGTGGFDACEWWSASFRSVFAAKRTLRFNGPTEKPKPKRPTFPANSKQDQHAAR